MSTGKTISELFYYSTPMYDVFVRPRDSRCEWDCTI